MRPFGGKLLLHYNSATSKPITGRTAMDDFVRQTRFSKQKQHYEPFQIKLPSKLLTPPNAYLAFNIVRIGALSVLSSFVCVFCPVLYLLFLYLLCHAYAVCLVYQCRCMCPRCINIVIVKAKVLLAQPFANTAVLSVGNDGILDFQYVTNHKTLLLHHNFTIRPSTGVYESRIFSSIYYCEFLVNDEPVDWKFQLKTGFY